MKNLLIIVLVIFSISAFSQAESTKPTEPNVVAAVNADTITYVKTGSFYTYKKSGINLNGQNLKEMYAGNKQCLNLYNGAMGTAVVSYIFAYSGGYLLGYGLATALLKGENMWGMVGVGAGLFAISLPIASAATKSIHKSVLLYNKRLKNEDIQPLSLNFGITGNGIGLRLQF